MLKIAIIGPESTGKTTLSEQLAKHFKTLFVPEFARTYIDQLDRKYVLEDLDIIAKGQIQAEENTLKKVQHLLICDTNLFVIKIWSDFVFGSCSEWIQKEIQQRNYDLYFLCDIDIPWEADPQREHPEQREEIFQRYKRELEKNKIDYQVLSGSEDERLKKAIEVIEKRRSFELM